MSLVSAGRAQSGRVQRGSCGARLDAPVELLELVLEQRDLLRPPLGVAPLLEQLGHHHVVAHLLGQSPLVLLQLRLTRLHLKPLLVQLGVARR